MKRTKGGAFEASERVKKFKKSEHSRSAASGLPPIKWIGGAQRVGI
jgi:hypothetical protein